VKPDVAASNGPIVSKAAATGDKQVSSALDKKGGIQSAWMRINTKFRNQPENVLRLFSASDRAAIGSISNPALMQTSITLFHTPKNVTFNTSPFWVTVTAFSDESCAGIGR